MDYGAEEGHEWNERGHSRGVNGIEVRVGVTSHNHCTVLRLLLLERGVIVVGLSYGCCHKC